MTPERYAQIKHLFLEAVELEDASREEFLRVRCGNDADLRREVETMLGHHDPRTIIPAPSAVTKAVASEVTHDDTPNPLLPGTGPSGKRPSNTRRIPRLGSNGVLALGVAIAAVLLFGFGVWQRAAVMYHTRNEIQHRIDSMLDISLCLFKHAVDHEKDWIQSVAQDPQLRLNVQHLVEQANADTDGHERLKSGPEQVTIRETIHLFADEHAAYAIWDGRQILIAESSADGDGIGRRAPSPAAALLAEVLRGKTVAFLPTSDRNLRPHDLPAKPTPAVDVATPLRDDQGRVVAALVVYWEVEDSQLSRYLGISRLTNTSEAYLFDRQGQMCSDSRFGEQLRETGLITAEGVPRVELRDPGGDLTNGFTPSTPLSSCPLTKAARHAIAGENGSDVDGYRNYLGVNVVGAWRWMPEYETGIAVEIAYDETYAGLRPVQNQFILSFVLLAASAVGIVISAYWISRLRRQAVASGRLGQYTLKQFLGEGGLGKVYRAHHAMLRRPVAVKFLKPDQTNRRTLAWFEREVQLASQLTHANTIAIYDYGTTPEGVFFYAMEYLPGITLEELVRLEGPIPWPRVVYILRQVCGSLREAHEAGLVHRDIKPHNIMLCERGREWDVVKVLDFGLVKSIDVPDGQDKNRSLVLAGTPLYMAPERWQDPTCVDVRSDVYSLGAVAFRLLTGKNIFTGNSEIDILMQVLDKDAPSPSQAASQEIPRELDQLVVACLAKNAADRPESMAEMIRVLVGLVDPQAWNSAMAQDWWEQNREKIRQLREPSAG